MFSRIGRRLALLNALVVVAVIAITGLLILVLLQRALSQEEERSLSDRVDAAALSWNSVIAAGQPIATASSESEDDHESDENEQEKADEHDERSPLETGDTFLFAFDRNGVLLIDDRGLTLGGLPYFEAVTIALTGESDLRTVDAGDDRVRLLTKPVWSEGTVIGVVQGARGLSEHESQRKLVLWFTVMGIAVGVIVAVPAGLFLSRRAMRPIQVSFEQQRRFVSDASHELRTPLSVIRAQAELIQRLSPPDSVEISEEANVVINEVDEMNRLVGDLLLLARTDETADAIEHGPVALSEIVRGATATFTEQTSNAGLTLSVNAGEQIWVNGDADRLRQIVRALIDNAIRYTPSGGSIDVTVERISGDARVTVSDTGIGIAPHDRSRIFDRFYRSDKARSRVSGGSGLGLAIAKALVVAHDGDIGIESTPGSGSTFWFAIPVSRDPNTV